MEKAQNVLTQTHWFHMEMLENVPSGFIFFLPPHARLEKNHMAGWRGIRTLACCVSSKSHHQHGHSGSFSTVNSFNGFSKFYLSIEPFQRCDPNDIPQREWKLMPCCATWGLARHICTECSKLKGVYKPAFFCPEIMNTVNWLPPLSV